MLARGVIGAVVVMVLAATPASAATTFTVTRPDDPPGGMCSQTDCSLRQAVAIATDGDTVALPAGTYVVLGAMGPIAVTHGITIAGAGSATTVIQTDPSSTALFSLASSMQATVKDVAVTGSAGPGVSVTAGAALLDHVDVHDNHHSGVSMTGGATLTIVDSTIASNTSGSDTASGNFFGGGIFARGGTLNMQRDTVSGNAVASLSAQALGGGIYVSDTAPTVAQLTNVTVTANTANAPSGTAEGGGLAVIGATSMTNLTIAGNSASGATAMGGNIARLTGINPGARSIANSIIAGGSATTGPNCFFLGPTLTSGGHNIQGTADCGFTATGDRTADPQLGPLTDNGGPTQTRVPAAGSLAIDNGDGLLCPATDQRGVPRPLGAGCDVGAVEVQPAPAVTTGAASAVGVNTATLGGTVNDFGLATTFTVQFGTTSAYGLQTAAQPVMTSFASTDVAVTIPGLAAGTLYHYRLVATSSAGTTDGADMTFVTATPTTPKVTVCVVPKLKGLTLSAARTKLTGVHCALGKVRKPKRARGKLVVRTQQFKAGAQYAAGTKVAVTLGAAPRKKHKTADR